MLSPLIRQLLTQFRRALDARFPNRVERVCLFGSWARGEATEKSDLDIAAVIRGLTTSEWNEARNIAVEVEAAVGIAFSPFIVSSERLATLARRGDIGADIAREGIDP